MKFYCSSQHIGIIDAIDVLTKLGHTTVNYSTSFHSHIHGWPQNPVDFQTSRFGDRGYCRAWMKSTEHRWKGCDAAISYYPPTMALAFAEVMPTILYCPVRLGLDAGAQFPAMLENLREFVDAGRIILAADSVYDQKCTEYHVKRPCRYIRPSCSYFKTNPPEGNNFYLDSRMQLPEMDGIVPMPSKNPWDWHCRGFLSVPYQVSTVSAHERLSNDYQYLVPSQKALSGIWKKHWAPNESDYGSEGYHWEDHLGDSDWYCGAYENVHTFDNFVDLNALLKNPPPVKPYDRERGVAEWEHLIGELSK